MSSKKELKMFTIRFDSTEEAFIEKARKLLNKNRPVGYRELDKTGTVRALLELGKKTFSETYSSATPLASPNPTNEESTNENFPNIEKVEATLFEIEGKHAFRMGLTANPKYRDLIFEGFELIKSDEDNPLHYPPLSEWILLVNEFGDANPEDSFRDSKNYDERVLSFRLLHTTDALHSIGQDVINGAPTKLVGVKTYKTLGEAEAEIRKALKFLGLPFYEKDAGQMFALDSLCFSRTLDLLNGFIHHYQNNYNGVDPLSYVHCCESFAQSYMEKFSTYGIKFPASFSFDGLFGPFAKSFVMLIHQSNAGVAHQNSSRLSISTKLLYRAFLSSLYGSSKEIHSTPIIELLSLRQAICSSNPRFLPDLTIDPKNAPKHSETFINATKDIPPLNEEFLRPLFGKIEPEVTELITAWKENGSAFSLSFVSKIDALLISKYNLDESMRLRFEGA